MHGAWEDVGVVAVVRTGRDGAGDGPLDEVIGVVVA